MGYIQTIRRMRRMSAVLSGVIAAGLASAAAPNWQWANTPDADTIGLFHFDETSFQKLPATVRVGVEEGSLGDFFVNDPALNSDFNLEFYNFNATGAGVPSLLEDVASPVLGQTSLHLSGPVQFRGYRVFGENVHEGDFTIEAWVKFNNSPGSVDLRLGTSDQLLRIIRDSANSTNDRIGYQGTHGAWLPHEGFSGFAELGVDEGEWFHIAMTIHSTGRYLDSVLQDHRYNPGAYAMIFVNGFLVGSHSEEDDHGSDDDHVHITRIPLDGTYAGNIIPPYHESDRLLLRNMNANSTVLVDEFTVRSKDVTNNGMITQGLFLNGDPGPASVKTWTLYE